MFAINGKGGSVLRLPAETKKARRVGGRGTKLKPGHDQGQNKFKCESFYSKTKTL